MEGTLRRAHTRSEVPVAYLASGPLAKKGDGDVTFYGFVRDLNLTWVPRDLDEIDLYKILIKRI